MNAFDFVFYVFSALILASAAIMVFARSVIYAAVGLLFTFFGVAGMYVLLAADFIAVAQVLIYVGGILVLLLFGVMLSQQKVMSVQMKTEALRMTPGLLAVAGIFAILFRIITATSWSTVPAPQYEPTAARIGTLLMTDFLIPFEIASVLLLGALIGAAFIARKEKA